MRLDGLRRPTHTARFNHVRIERPLDQPFHFTNLLFESVRLLVEDLNKFVADNLPLLLRIGDSCEAFQETVTGVYSYNVQTQLLTQALLDFLELILPQHAVVHEDGDEAASNGAVNQSGGHRPIHPPPKNPTGPSPPAPRLPPP